MKTRKTYSAEYKRQTVEAFRAGKLTPAALEKKGIYRSMLTRWAQQLDEESAAKAPASEEAEITVLPSSVESHSSADMASDDGVTPELPLNVQRQENGRYRPADKEAVQRVIASGRLSISEISAKTGISHAVLYVWEKRIKAGRNGTERNGTALVPASKGKGYRPVIELDHADRQSEFHEGLANLVKAKRQLILDHKNGVIDDLSQYHLRTMLAIKQILGES